MTNKKTMKEVLHTDKDIIENLTRENYELKEMINVLEKNSKDPEEFIKNIYSYDILIHNPLYKSLCDTNEELIKINKQLQTKVNELEISNKKISQEMEKLTIKQNYMDKFLEKHGFNDPDDLVLFINKHSNPIKIENDPLYIELKNSNEVLTSTITGLNETIVKLNDKISNLENINNDKNNNNMNESIFESKIKEELDKQKVNFDNSFNLYKKEQEEKYNILNDNFIKLQNKKVINELPPTPSSSSDKKEKITKDNKNNIISLPEDLNMVVYYRRLNIDKFKSSYFKYNNKCYLRCCGQDYKEKEINYNNSVTCVKCYKNYKLSEKNDSKNNLYEIFSSILPEHIIDNEEEIYNKIKCNSCNHIDKKEIDFCFRCKKLKKSKIIIPEIFPSKEESGYKTVSSFAGETLNTIKYNANIYQTALDEGVNVYEMKPLIKYIKENKLMEEKQSNIIINKIIRSHAILHIFKNDKYISIKDIIERIYIDIKAVSKLDENQWPIFRNNLITKLDNELKK